VIQYGQLLYQNMNDPLEITLRIACAALAGIVLGLNRWIHHKSAGVKTHALVAIGSAAAVMCVLPGIGQEAQSAAVMSYYSRVLQGLLAGIGFLGAGVIIHNARGTRIQGLTTAASIWATTVLGAAFGNGLFMMASIALGAIGIALVAGNWLERQMGKLVGQDPVDEHEADSP
jgi:putative Mg2+ transporter-C (MgtC) family protein